MSKDSERIKTLAIKLIELSNSGKREDLSIVTDGTQLSNILEYIKVKYTDLPFGNMNIIKVQQEINNCNSIQLGDHNLSIQDGLLALVILLIECI